ncbi:MAG TPA: hypothetical protein VG602_10435 [Actinomycetota bacterium]|nr:hypothetical protein [Actinomycetota bacterium]
MAMVVLLLSGGREEISLGPKAASQLAAHGVTRAAVLRDRDAIAVVLEGWAFDPSRSMEAAVEAVLADAECRRLTTVAELSVSRGGRS